MITKTDLQNTLIAFKNNLDQSSSSDSELEDRVSELERFVYPRYGIRIDQSNSDPEASVTYLYDAVGMEPVSYDGNGNFDYGDWQDFVYDICKPVMLNPDGTVKYELDRDDQTKKTDGTASEISDSTQTANAMVQFKKLYLSLTGEGRVITAVFSKAKYDETYKAFPFIDENGAEKDYAYYSMFEGVPFSTIIRSLVTSNYITQIKNTTAKTYCMNNGSGWDWPSFTLKNHIDLLHVLVSKSLNSQSVFGKGNVSNSGTRIRPGATVSYGGFTRLNNDNKSSVKSFWIENLWGNAWILHNGLYIDNNRFYQKDTPPYPVITNAALFSPAKYELTGITRPSQQNIITRMTVRNGILLPVAVGGSNSTYWCDQNRTISYDYGTHMMITGSNAWDGDIAGLFALYSQPVNANLSPTDIVGVRLSYV